MKKSVRPAASKVSGERGKTEATSSTGTGKPTTKSSTTAPLPKVRHHLMTCDTLKWISWLFLLDFVQFSSPRLKAMMIF